MVKTHGPSAEHDSEGGCDSVGGCNQSSTPCNRDDLHLRTVTTLLCLFSGTDRTKYKTTLPRGTSSSFRKMLAVSTLLARGTDVVACVPHMTVDTTTLFCLREGKPEEYVSEHSHFGSKNASPPAPPDSPPPPPIKLLQVPEVNLDRDIVSYLVTNW